MIFTRPILAALVIIASLSAPAGCRKTEARKPGELFVAIEVEPRTLDPRYYTDAASSKIGGLIFEGLVRNDGVSIKPGLAQKWETPSPATYVFHLRPGLKFHDGKRLTSRDVKASFEHVMNPENKSPRMAAFSGVKSITAPDELTVKFELKAPSAPFLGELAMGITPAGSGKEMEENPAGAGPFMLRQRENGRVDLAAFKDYHEGAPKINRLVFRIIPDETVRILELEQGGVDLIMNPITPDVLPRFEKNPALVVLKSQGTNYSYLGFNMEDKITGDMEVRRALAMAIDRASIITHIMKGLATRADGMFPEGSPWHAEGLASHPYDPEEARRILDNAGYEDPDGEGPALRFTLQFSTSQNELRKRLAEVYQWQLSKVGVGLDIRSYEWGTFYSHIVKGNFQMYSLTWVGISDPDIMHYIFHSSMIPPNGANRGRYRNNEVDAATERGKSTFGDDRAQVYAVAQREIARELPYIPLWHSVNVAVAARGLKGFELAPDESLESLKTATMERAEK